MSPPPQLTLFAIPKAFHGHVGVIQRNAIGSWIRLGSRIRVVLLGDDDGVAEAARELGVEHLPGIARTALGTPRLDDAFAQVEAAATTDLLTYVNCDIILQDDFLEAVLRLPAGPLLMIGRRWNTDIVEPLDFDQVGWRAALASRVQETGTLGSCYGMDYFVFRRNTLGRLPPFAVGRPGWDNWMVYHALERRLLVIDATPSLRAVHQNHDYGHVPRGTGSTYEGPEADENRRLKGAPDRTFSTHDATHALLHGQVVPNVSLDTLRGRWETMFYRYPALRGCEPWSFTQLHERLGEGSLVTRRPLRDLWLGTNNLRPKLLPLWSALRRVQRRRSAPK
jgi:hypothetical protein